MEEALVGRGSSWKREKTRFNWQYSSRTEKGGVGMSHKREQIFIQQVFIEWLLYVRHWKGTVVRTAEQRSSFLKLHKVSSRAELGRRSYIISMIWNWHFLEVQLLLNISVWLQLLRSPWSQRLATYPPSPVAGVWEGNCPGKGWGPSSLRWHFSRRTRNERIQWWWAGLDNNSDLKQVPRGLVFFLLLLWVPFNSQIRHQIFLTPRVVLDGFLAWNSWALTKEQDC